jgi:hypothetical protein
LYRNFSRQRKSDGLIKNAYLKDNWSRIRKWIRIRS